MDFLKKVQILRILPFAVQFLASCKIHFQFKTSDLVDFSNGNADAFKKSTESSFI